jgi:hypothetical protein
MPAKAADLYLVCRTYTGVGPGYLELRDTLPDWNWPFRGQKVYLVHLNAESGEVVEVPYDAAAE